MRKNIKKRIFLPKEYSRLDHEDFNKSIKMKSVKVDSGTSFGIRSADIPLAALFFRGHRGKKKQFAQGTAHIKRHA